VLVAGFVFVPTITGVALAYGYLLAPILLPIVSPLAGLLPPRLKEILS
jgi:CDP-diacylglycerol--serine O-phosphatidyltransferase